MRVRDWQDIVQDVVESDAAAADWRAVAGDRANGVGEDLYLGHPDVGVYQLKTYAKNPFEVRGVGTRVARRVDEEVGRFFPSETGGRFAVRSPPEDESVADEQASRVEEVVQAHADAPTTPDALFDDMMDALDSPAFGPMEYDMTDRADPLDELATTFDEAEEVLETEFEDVVADDEVGKSFR